MIRHVKQLLEVDTRVLCEQTRCAVVLMHTW
jgi:hypothetical protein